MAVQRTKIDELSMGFMLSIREGRWPVGMKLPSERQIAADQGMSRATVKQAIQRLEGLGLVESIQGSGTYVIDRAGARPQTSCTSVSLVLPASMEMRTAFARTSFYPEMLGGVNDALAESGARLTMAPFRREDWLSDAASLDERVGQGIIVANSALAPEDFNLLLNTGLPLVTVGRPRADVPVSFVDMDHAEAMEQCADHLIAQGHRKIALWNGRPETRHAQTRLAVLGRKLEAAGSAIDMELVVQVDDDAVAEGSKRLVRVFREGRATAAIVTGSASLAHLSEAVRATGKRVPEDIGIVAYGDSPFVPLCPGVVVMHMPSYRLGWDAATMLLDQIASPSPILRERLLHGRLDVRVTTTLPAGSIH